MYAFHVAQAGDGGFVCAGGARCGIRVRSGVGANEIAGTEFVCNPTACFRCGAKTWPYRPMGPRAGSPGFHPGLVDLALQAGIADIGTQASGGCQSPVTARRNAPTCAVSNAGAGNALAFAVANVRRNRT
jgi:hypothetical protein